MNVQIPAQGWVPRPYQLPLLKHMAPNTPGLRAVVAWHRRAHFFLAFLPFYARLEVCSKEATPTQKTPLRSSFDIGKTIKGKQWSNGPAQKWSRIGGSMLRTSTQNIRTGKRKGVLSIASNIEKKNWKGIEDTTLPSAGEGWRKKLTGRTPINTASVKFSNITEGSGMLSPFWRSTRKLFLKYTAFALNSTMPLLPSEPRRLLKWTIFGLFATKISADSMLHGTFKYSPATKMLVSRTSGQIERSNP